MVGSKILDSVSLSKLFTTKLKIKATGKKWASTLLLVVLLAGLLASFSGEFKTVVGDNSQSPQADKLNYVTASSGNGGNINPSGVTVVTPGSNQAFTISTDIGNKIQNIEVDGTNKYFANYSFSQRLPVNAGDTDEKVAIVNGQRYLVTTGYTHTNGSSTICIYEETPDWNVGSLVASSPFIAADINVQTCSTFPDCILICGSTTKVPLSSQFGFISCYNITSNSWQFTVQSTNYCGYITNIYNPYATTILMQTCASDQFAHRLSGFYESNVENLFNSSSWTYIAMPTPLEGFMEGRIAYFNGAVFWLEFNHGSSWDLYRYNISSATWDSSYVMGNHDLSMPDRLVFPYVWADSNMVIFTAPTSSGYWQIYYSTDGTNFDLITQLYAVSDGFTNGLQTNGQASHGWANYIGNGLIAFCNSQDENPSSYIAIIDLNGNIINRGAGFGSHDTTAQFLHDGNYIVTGAEDCAYWRSNTIGIKVITINQAPTSYTYTFNNVMTNHTITASFSSNLPPSSPVLKVSCVSSTSYSAFDVKINGNLTFNGTGITGVPILLSYKTKYEELWHDLTLVNTDSEGNFIAEWLPPTVENYFINATYIGNSSIQSVSTVFSLATTPFEWQNNKIIFSVASNSTVTELAFNSTNQELSFTVNGPSGTIGYIDAFIVKSLVENISNVKVYVDNMQENFTVESLQNSWLIHFTYHHSTHSVRINLPATESTSNLKTFIISAVTIVAVFGSLGNNTFGYHIHS